MVCPRVDAFSTPAVPLALICSASVVMCEQLPMPHELGWVANLLARRARFRIRLIPWDVLRFGLNYSKRYHLVEAGAGRLAFARAKRARKKIVFGPFLLRLSELRWLVC